MANIIELPNNIIGIEDHEAIESFGAHEISHGRASRFHWDTNNNGDPIFEVYRGGVNEELVLTITRDRKKDEFQATRPNGSLITSGTLDHVMAELDKKLTQEHDESDTSA